MSDKNALDLSAVDPAVWRIMVNDVVYGPYTFGQMKSFSEEGRLSDTSKVAFEDGGAFQPAFQHVDLMPLFQVAAPDKVRTPETEPSNFMISVQTDGDGRRAVIALLNEIGRFSELMPGCFILDSETPIRTLRTQLATVLAERGRCVIVNARSGQLAWVGLRPDADAHAKVIWKRDA